MKNFEQNRTSERGGAGVKFLLVGVVLALILHAGYQYVPIAYEGASLRQDMDTAVVKGISASGQLKPIDVVKSSIQNAIRDNNVPSDAIIEIKPSGAAIQAQIMYSKQVPMLPFGIYKYKYDFNYVAIPKGYLLKQ